MQPSRRAPDGCMSSGRERRTEQERERAAAGGRWGWRWPAEPGKNDLIVTTREGNPLSPEEQWRRFQWLLEWAGIPPNPCHRQRHTAAHLMLTQGIPLEVAQAILGHASFQITGANYGHVQSAAQAQAVQSRRTALVGRPRKPPKVSPKVA